jgi:hypothetical protein
MEDQSLRDVYRELVRLNRQCFEASEFDIAYHCLMAALHAAQELKDIPYLREVEKTADGQLKHIDAHHPQYEHSTFAAANRNHVSIYQTLARQANARIVIIQNTPRHTP